MAAFSAAGDAAGYASVSGLHIGAQIWSASGSIGANPGVPVFAIWASVFVGAQPGSVTSLTLDSGATATDAKGNPYAVTVTPGQLTVNNSMSIQDVVPGGGTVGPGAIVRITGSGFDATTAVTINGLKLASQNLLNTGEIDVTVDPSSPAVEMTGRHVHLVNAAGEQVDYFASLPSSDPPSTFHVILPLSAFASGLDSNLGGYTSGIVSQQVAMLNQNSTPVTVELVYTTGSPGETFLQQTVVIPPGMFSWGGALGYDPQLGSELLIAASAPIRMALVVSQLRLPPNPTSIYLFALGSTGALPPFQPIISTSSASWSWAIGSPQPAPAGVQIGGDLPFTASVSGGQWLTVTPAPGTAPPTLLLVPNPGGLAPGTYSATVSISPIVPASLPNLQSATATITASLTVSASPLISAGSVSWSVLPGISTNPTTTWISTNGGPVPFTVVPPAGAAWFTVAPLSGTTPAVLTFTADALGTTDFSRYSASVLVRGPNNTASIPVSLAASFPGNLAPPVVFTADPAGVSFLLSSAPATSQTQGVHVQPASASLQATSQASNGGDWLTAVFADGSPGTLNISASTANLIAGSYSGEVTITELGQSSSLQIPVVLHVYDPPSPQTVLTAAVSSQTISVTSSDTQVYFTVEGASANSNVFDGRLLTPATLQYAASPNLPPGVYQWNVVIHWINGDLTIPVSATVPAPATALPSVASVLNAGDQASFLPVLVPGEIMSIYGLNLGAATAGLAHDASGKVVTQLGGTSVLIGGVPAPLLYVSPTQVNFVVPYEVSGSNTAIMQIVTSGGSITTAPLTVSASAPGIFTIPTVQSQAAVLNQDSSVNSLDNPAARGSVIQIFATGGGQTSPPGVTGSVTGANPSTQVLPVSVTVGGVDAPVQFAGSAPDAVAGLLQVNALLPAGVPIGSRIPIVLTVGGVASGSGIFIAVE